MVTSPDSKVKYHSANPSVAEVIVAAAEPLTKSGLGVLSSRGWYQRSIHCPCGGHGRKDHHRSCSVKKDGSLYCHTTDTFYGQREAAALLRVTLPESDSKLNRHRRRSANHRLKRVTRKGKQRLSDVIADLPTRYRRLLRFIIEQSARYGTCVMSHAEIGRHVSLCREEVCRRMRELREMGLSVKLGYYVIGFNPELHHRGLEMRVCVEAPLFSEVALDEKKFSHTMLLIRSLMFETLPKFVHFVGYSALIQYQFQ